MESTWIILKRRSFVMILAALALGVLVGCEKRVENSSKQGPAGGVYPGLKASPAGGLTLTERGTPASFTIVLTGKPSDDVTIELVSTDASEGSVFPASVKFSPATWETPQTVIITPVDDAIVDGPQVFSVSLSSAASVDASYAALGKMRVQVTNNDDEIPLLVVSAVEAYTNETGATDTFTVSLSNQPMGTVLVNVALEDATEGALKPNKLTFTSANWSTPQTVTVSGVDDKVSDGNQTYPITLSAAGSEDLGYRKAPVKVVSVTNMDDDTPGVSIIGGGKLETSELGNYANFGVVLNHQPMGNVTVSITSGDLTEGTVSPAQVEFTPANWQTPQNVTITPVRDWIVDGLQTYPVTLSAKGSVDTVYQALPPVDLMVDSVDADSVGIRVSPTGGLYTNEKGMPSTFEVYLSSKPSANVTIPFTSSNEAEVVIQGAVANLLELTFTPDNFNTPQTVTLIGQDDLGANNLDASVWITSSAAVSTDLAYSGLGVSSVYVINYDNATASLIVGGSVASLASFSEAQVISLTFKLSRVPLAPVAVTLSIDNTNAATVDYLQTKTLYFDKFNYNTLQYVYVRGSDNPYADGNRTYNLTFSPMVSTDTGFDGVVPGSYSGTVTDNETLGFTGNYSNALYVAEGGSSKSFYIRPTSSPYPGNVITVDFASTNPIEGATVSPASMSWTDANYRTWQYLTVTPPAGDNIVDGHQFSQITLSTANSTEATYAAVSLPSSSVITADVDDPWLYVATTGTVNNAPGMATPHNSVDTAANLASNYVNVDPVFSFQGVKVAAGTYTSTSSVPVWSNMQLLGGYSTADWNVRDPAVNVTTLQNVANGSTSLTVPDNSAVYFAYNSMNNLVDGFTLIGGSGSNSRGVFVYAYATGVLSNNVISGGSGTARSYGILSYGGAGTGQATILNNVITGGGASGFGALNIGVYGGSRPLTQNTILGALDNASPSGQTIGVFTYYGDMVGNDITAGPVNTINTLPSSSYGILNIYNTGATLTNNIIRGSRATTSAGGFNVYRNAKNNIISGGAAATNSYGLYNSRVGAENNLISGGTAQNVIGVYGYGAYRNNTIFSGVSTLKTGILQSVAFQASNLSTLQNNILFNDGYGVCLYSSVTTYFQGLNNNDLFNCPNALLYYGATSYSTLATLEALSANFTGNAVDDPLLVSPGGPDTWVYTLDDNDWSLNASTSGTPSPASVRTGGLDGAASAWGYSIDLSGATRTGDGVMGWSMGAYEQDN